MLDRIKKLQNQVSYLSKESVWHSIQEMVLRKPWFSFLFSMILLLLGAFTAAIINFISSDSANSLLQHIISFSLCIFILVFGFIYFIDHWRFRKKYVFLEDYDVDLAKKIVSIHKRAKRSLTLIDGINAIQIFQIERHTTDEDIIFRFKTLFTLKSKYFSLSKFRKTRLIIPISFFNWIITEEKKSIPNESKFNHMTHAWLVAEQIRDPQLNFNNLIDNWDYKDKNLKKKINSVHFHVLFDTMESITLSEYDYEDILDYIQIMKYNGKKNKHSNRQYCTLRLTLTSDMGSVECVLQVIVNQRINTNDELVYVFNTILSGLGVKE